MKDEVKIYDKLDKKIINKFTIATQTYYFKKWTTILHYFTLPTTKNLLFSTIYICPHFLYKNLVFYITKILLNFIKMQKY